MAKRKRASSSNGSQSDSDRDAARDRTMINTNNNSNTNHASMPNGNADSSNECGGHGDEHDPLLAKERKRKKKQKKEKHRHKRARNADSDDCPDESEPGAKQKSSKSPPKPCGITFSTTSEEDLSASYANSANSASTDAFQMPSSFQRELEKKKKAALLSGRESPSASSVADSTDNALFAFPGSPPSTKKQKKKDVEKVHLGLQSPAIGIPPSPRHSPSPSTSAADRPPCFVAHFPHSHIANWQKAAFSEHVQKQPRRDLLDSLKSGATTKPKRFYILRSDVNDRVLHCGYEQTAEASGGFDYCIAVVDRATGAPVRYIPTKLARFEPTHVEDRAIALGEKPVARVDYSQNFEGDFESRWKNKKRLTADFGGIKSQKILEASQRRKVGESSLDAMISTALASSKAVSEVRSAQKDAKGADQKTIEALANPDVAMLRQAESSVLPPANMEAELAKDVYSWDLFIKQGDLEAMAPVALELFTSKTKVELLALGFPELVLRLIPGWDTIPNKAIKERKAFAYMLLATYHEVYKVCTKSKGRSIGLNDLLKLPMPSPFIDKVRAEFLGEALPGQQKAIKIQCSRADLDRLLCYLLVLVLIMDVGSYCLPLSPWAHSLGIPERRISPLLKALGCNIMKNATVNEKSAFYSVQLARLVGPPQKASGRKRMNKRRTL